MYKVLLVEDEDIIRKGLMFTMDWLEFGCTVVSEAVNGKDGLEKIGRFCPDIVITDVKMPFTDGIEILKESIEEFGYEAIIISGYSEFEYAREAVSLGVSEYLLKPLDMELLGRALRKIIHKIAAKREVRDLQQVSGISAEWNAMHSVLSKESQHTKNVREMLDYIENSYDKKISIGDLCDRLNLSATYLNTNFKNETNYTFNDFLNRYRIFRAIDILKNSEMKVYQAAEAVGFQDYKYFIQVFKKYIGCSPIKFLNTLEESRTDLKKEEAK